jgi:hypothetical protein
VRPNVIRKKNVVLNRDMAREGHLIRKDIIVANLAVMRDVHPNHEKVARTDSRRLPLAVRPVESAELAYQIIIANLQETLFAFELNVLRLAADNRMLEYSVARAQACKTFDHGISRDLTIRANFDVVLYYGGWMNTHLQGFEDNRVLWIVQILFMMLGGLMCSK